MQGRLGPEQALVGYKDLGTQHPCLLHGPPSDHTPLGSGTEGGECGPGLGDNDLLSRTCAGGQLSQVGHFYQGGHVIVQDFKET